MAYIYISDKRIMDRRNNHKHIQKSLFSEFQPEAIKPLSVFKQNARWVMGTCLVVSDIFSIFASYILAILLRRFLYNGAMFSLSPTLITFVFVYILIYALYGLYPGVGLSPVDEIKKLLTATNFSFLVLLAVTYFSQTSITYSRFVLASAWLLSIVLVQLDRWFIRIIGRNLGFWGEPVAVIGNGPIGYQIVEYLNNNIRLGMRPYLMLDGNSSFNTTTIGSINTSRISTAILVIPEMSEELQRSFIYEQRHGYHRRKGEKNIPRLILISSLSWVGSLGVSTHDLGGILGLEVRQNLLNNWAKIIKRLMDILLIIIFGVLISPFLPLIFALILLDSPGGIFYQQERIGQQGKTFKILKFRTMVSNADQVLKDYLEKYPELRAEWESSQKMKLDPRITKVGKFLRKWSLDELPQLWNILKGEMSLVGPRPIVTNEIKHYKDVYKLYKQVNPGLTGIWQISGRTDTGYKQRINFDEYYIRNWSIWLDIYILIRTIYVVLTKKGAY